MKNTQDIVKSSRFNKTNFFSTRARVALALQNGKYENAASAVVNALLGADNDSDAAKLLVDLSKMKLPKALSWQCLKDNLQRIRAYHTTCMLYFESAIIRDHDDSEDPDFFHSENFVNLFLSQFVSAVDNLNNLTFDITHFSSVDDGMPKFIADKLERDFKLAYFNGFKASCAWIKYHAMGVTVDTFIGKKGEKTDFSYVIPDGYFASFFGISLAFRAAMTLLGESDLAKEFETTYSEFKVWFENFILHHFDDTIKGWNSKYTIGHSIMAFASQKVSSAVEWEELISNVGQPIVEQYWDAVSADLLDVLNKATLH